MFRHVVLYTWKNTLSNDKIAEIYEELDRISAVLPGRIGYSWGLNNSKEGRNQGYTHCLVADFIDEAGRDAFINDKARIALSVNKVVPNMVDGLRSVVSFDFEWK